MKQEAWTFILANSDVSSRIAFLADVCRALGVFNPSEHTAAAVASMAFIGIQIKPTDVHHLRELKMNLLDQFGNEAFGGAQLRFTAV